MVELERNPDYFVPGRPYLDGIRRLGHRPERQRQRRGDHKRAPFDSSAVRRAVNFALDRHAYVKGVRHDGAVVGAALMSPPHGSWGLAEARRLLAEAGFGSGKPPRVDLTTRNIAIYVDLASFVADQLRQVPALARRDYQIGANLTASGIDDPDGYLFENYRCGASRNYTDYCNEAMDRLIEQQSGELDRATRLKLVWDIQRKLEAEVARPMLGWRNEYFTHWPYVKNLLPHNSLYNYARMQEVWLDK